MKIRTDFVTNSSSSSFVIGKIDDTYIDVEYVYQILKDYYNELLEKRDMLIEYIKSNPKLGIEYIKEERYSHFEFIKGKSFSDRNYEIKKNIERDFGLDIWDYYANEYGWLKCETYKDYERYWIDKMVNYKGENPYNVHAPFTIVDFLKEQKVNWLHWNHFYRTKDDEEFDEEDNISYVNEKSDVLRWYYDNADIDKKLAEIRDVVEDNICLHLLGRVCIHSECGYIPDYVVSKLYDISEKACNHMG